MILDTQQITQNHGMLTSLNLLAMHAWVYASFKNFQPRLMNVPHVHDMATFHGRTAMTNNS